MMTVGAIAASRQPDCVHVGEKLMQLPRYEPELFTGRDQEIKQVEEFVTKLLANERPVSRTIVFRGARGFGKSWLAIHLKRFVLARHDQVLPFFIGLGQHYERILKAEQPGEWVVQPGDDPSATVAQLVDWLAGELGAVHARDADTNDLAGSIMQTITSPPFGRPPRRARVLALIIDSVFEADWELLKQLEATVLGRLATLPNVLIVLTGRGRAFPWETPQLNFPAAAVTLPSYDVADVKEQLRRQLPGESFSDQEIEEIIKTGHGFPLNNLLLGQVLRKGLKLNDVISELLSFVADSADLREVRLQLEALCLLERFREDQIMPMVRRRQALGRMGRPGDERAELDAGTLTEARRVKDELVRLGLMRWEGGGFVIDPSIRVLMAHYLERERPTIALGLHEAAQQMYEAVNRDAPNDYYAQRAEHHAERARQLRERI